MIQRSILEQAVAAALAAHEGVFLVSLKATPADDIELTVDTASPAGLDIDTCAAISRAVGQAIEAAEGPEADFSLEVGSAGLTAPFTVHGQYVKNVGQRVEVLTADGLKFKATLTAAARNEADGTTDVTLAVTRKVKPEGARRPVEQTVEEHLNSSQIKKINCLLDF